MNSTSNVDVQKTYHADGSVKIASYFKDGKLQVVKTWNEDGILVREEHWKDGQLHRDDGPALREWKYNGDILNISYYCEGLRHRDPNDGPAEEWWHDNDNSEQLYQRGFYWKGLLHRDPTDGPALEEWFDDGKLRKKAYVYNGKFHSPQKEDGSFEPGYWVQNRNGTREIKKYYQPDNMITAQ